MAAASMRASLATALLILGLVFDQSAQEPLYISNEVVVDPYDQPPPKRDTSRSYSISTGVDTLDPNGTSPNRQLLPVNES